MATTKNGAGGQPPTAAAVVAEALAQIVLTEMAPGTSMPSEGDLALRFEVSRLTVREAIKMLAGRGLLDDPGPQFGRDRLVIAHGQILAQSRRRLKTKRSGSDAPASNA